MKNTHKIQRGLIGFTLVELLVVLAIILILTSLVFVGVGAARAKADAVLAENRIKNLQVANAAYAADNNGNFVPAYAFDENANVIRGVDSSWVSNPYFLDLLAGLAANASDPTAPIWSHPKSILDPVAVKSRVEEVPSLFGSYGYIEEGMPGGDIGQANTMKRWNAATLPDASRTAAFATANDWLVRYSGRHIWESRPFDEISTQGKMAYRHRDSAIVVFYDGHTEFLSMDDIKSIDEAGGADNVFWGGSVNGRGK